MPSNKTTRRDDFKRTVQFMAEFLPQEQVAFCWQTQVSARPQQVVGLTIVTIRVDCDFLGVVGVVT